MLTYARWKYVVFLIVLLLSAVYAVPNMFPQDPSVQVTANRGAPVDEALRKRVADGLKTAGVATKEVELDTMKNNRIWAAAIDVTAEEPLPAASPLWTLPNVFVTPHTAGETRAYEDNVIDILVENLDRLWRDEKAALRNQVL